MYGNATKWERLIQANVERPDAPPISGLYR